MFYLWMLVLAVISVIWAFMALRSQKKVPEIKSVKRELDKRRIIFQSESTSS